MIRKYIGLLADTQLDKRLYGLEDTRRDWFRALEQGFESLYAVKEELSAIFVLGDIFDAESVGSEAAFSFQSALAKFAKEDIPILLILGNHDSNPSKSINWISVCKLVNPHVVELNFKEPFTLPAEGNLSAINVLGNNNLSRDRMADALKTLIQPSTAGINWLCLHQALAELAPHPDAWDVMAQQVPEWIQRVWLGDFHNHDAHTDTRGIEFVYPGAIESVSFNQTEKPGFVLYDRATDTYSHVSTQQRDYLTFRLKPIPPHEWETHLATRIEASTHAHDGRKPVVRVYYPSNHWQIWDELQPKLAPTCLKLMDNQDDVPVEPSGVDLIDIEDTADTREEIQTLACKILDAEDNDVSTAVKNLLLNPSSLADLRTSQFPKAVTK